MTAALSALELTMNRTVLAVAAIAAATVALLAWTEGPARADDAPKAVCEKFSPAVAGALPKEKVEAFINEQLAAGRTNVEGITSGVTNSVLVCTW